MEITVTSIKKASVKITTEGTGQSNWVNRASNALTNNVAKPIARALDPGKTTAGAFASTGKAVGGAFVAAGSMAVAAEAAASGAMSAVGDYLANQAGKVIANPVFNNRIAQGVGMGVGLQALEDVSEGKISPPRKYMRQAATGVFTGVIQQQLSPNDNPIIMETILSTNPTKETIKGWVSEKYDSIFIDSAVGAYY